MNAAYPTWDAAYAAWAGARRAELEYRGDDKEADRLGDVRDDLEDAIFELPALTTAHLATKILIALDDDRGANSYFASILRDCRRFASDELTRGKLSEGVEPWDLSPVVGGRAALDEYCAALLEAWRLPEEDPNYEPALHRAAKAENRLLSTPALSGDGVIAKLIVIAQEVSFGGCPDEDRAREAVQEAIAFFGMGCIDPNTENTERAHG